MKGGVRFLTATCLIFVWGAFLAGCDRRPPPKQIDEKDLASENELQHPSSGTEAGIVRFGFDHRASPEEDVKQYLPFLDYLSRATGYHFEIHFTPEDGNIVEELGTGKVQFAAVGAGSYLQAHERYGAVPVARGLNALGKAEYRSVIVVRPESKFQTVEDLRGKSFAFGDFNSTQGHVIPRIVLKEHGIDVTDLALRQFTGSHRKCADAVISGKFDAGGMQDTLGNDLVRQGLLRILFTSRYYPSSGIAAGAQVPPEMLAKVRQALLDFQPKGRDASGLYHWDLTEMPNGFVAAAEEDYTELRNWMQKFGLLGKPSGERQP